MLKCFRPKGETMKAMVLHEIGGPDKLSYEDAPDPEPGSGETVVRLHAAALNRRDVFVTRGQYPGAKPEALPVILGSDGSGEVVARGEGADGPDEGTEVVINPALYWGDDPRVPGKEYRILGIPDDGTFAQFIKVPADHVFPKPSHLSHQEAAALPLAALTAYRALVTRGGVAGGETVLVPGVGGGVDLSADHVGGENFNALVSLARPGGRIVVIGATAGPTSRAMTIRIALKQLDVLGTAMGTAEEFGAMLDLYAEHGLHPKVNETFALEDIASALHLMEEGSGIGKIVLDIPA